MPNVQNISYDKLLLESLRLVSYTPGTEALTNENLVKAMTVNENLNSLGLTLTPNDLIALASSPDLDLFYDKVSGLMSSVEAKPMYPDFPTQVMDMDEATFRMHQLIHYFSTYGVEELLGTPVLKGWLPAEAGLVSDTEKTEKDTRLLESEAIELISEDQKYTQPFLSILKKRERMTDMEKEIVKAAVLSGDISFDKKVEIPFKENIRDTFNIIAKAGADGEMERGEASKALYNICQHPGDVIDAVHSYMTKKDKYHLTSREKKMFIDLLEKYPDRSFIENVTVSRKQAQHVQEIFKRLDFNTYSHDEEKKKAVKEIGKALSWEGKARAMIANAAKNNDPVLHNQALSFISSRPGMMLRMTSFMLRNGFTSDEIIDKLKEHAGKISVQTTVTLINKTAENVKINLKFRSMEENKRKSEGRRVENKIKFLPEENKVYREILKERLRQIETPLKGQKVYFDETTYDFGRIAADPSQKTQEQGYLPSAVVTKIPDDAKRVRFFVYWNDDRRVDVDLHAAALTKDGEPVHIGWNGGFNDNKIVFSGDITHSNAAEYIDIDLEKTNVANVKMSLDVYSISGIPCETFSHIDKCFAGIMAVDKLGENVVLYDPANCFCSNDIINDCRTINYGEVDVVNRTVKYLGIEQDRDMMLKELDDSSHVHFSLRSYLELLTEAQRATIVETPEEADMILTLTKPTNEKDVSLIDNNYFYDAKVPEDNVGVVASSKEEILNEMVQEVGKVDPMDAGKEEEREERHTLTVDEAFDILF